MQKNPIKIIELDEMTRIMHRRYHQLIIDHGGEGQGIVVLGNDRVPLRTRRMRQVNGYDATPGCLAIGIEIEHRIDIAQEGILRIRLIQQADERASTVHGAIVETIGSTAAMPDVQYQVRAVISYPRQETQFLVVGSFVH